MPLTTVDLTPSRPRERRTLTIDPRHGGLPGCVHGGYVAGLLAGTIDADAACVRLLAAVPPSRPLELETSGDAATLRDGAELLADAAAAPLALDLPAPVDPETAHAASALAPDAEDHRFPDCYACGPRRSGSDGLRVFCGPVSGRRLVAGLWTPDPTLGDASGRLPRELVWAALDCPGLWALILRQPTSADAHAVTGTLHTDVRAPVVAGEPHVVMAWPIERCRRTLVAGAALLGPDGRVCALARQTAVLAPWGVPLSLARWGRAAVG